MSEMTEQRLIRWLEAGYPYLKAGSQLPAWLLPERSLNSAADKLGDQAILEMSQSLDLAKGTGSGQVPDPATFSPEDWQKAVEHWPPLPQVRPIVEALLGAADRIVAYFCTGEPGTDRMMVCRSMAVLAFAPFITEGKPVIEELACILDGNASQPAELITRYAEVVLSGDGLTVEEINQCIVRYSSWAEWAATVQELTLKCQYTPRLIAVTPPLSPELVGALVSMIKEGHHDES